MMKKYGYIYKFTYLPKNLIYVGKRKSIEFDVNYYGSGVMWRRIISKCDKETDIKREILEWCYSLSELNEREIFWIRELDATNHLIGCNIALGGDGGNYTDITRQKISNTMHERGTQQGKNNGAYGKHWFTDGLHSVFCEECPEGYFKGVGSDINDKRIKKLSNISRTDEQKEHYRCSKLGDKNPMKLRCGCNHPNYGKKCYKSPDGLKSGYYLPGDEPNGWVVGMRYSLSKIENRCGKNNPAYGKHFYNNGKIQVFQTECPEGFVMGMLKRG